MKLQKNTWLKTDTEPFIIAGPCSAESENQIMNTGRLLAKIPQVQVFRAGIWKPRTRPRSFEGIGEKGLDWLQKLHKETGLKTAVEIANSKHVELSLKAGIDMLWIGARTTVNPFSVQEISEALRGVDIPVIIKNPINPDLQLWIGALERMNDVGIDKLIAVHRGFHTFENSLYRYDPVWEIPIELKRLFPDLPLFCDPSHIAGNSSMITAVAQSAMDMDMKGLMIEVHHDPKNAYTDSAQQIRPADLQTLINELIVRKTCCDDQINSQLDELRSQIDKLDRKMLDALSKRMNIVHLIGALKKEYGITSLQIHRWNSILSDRSIIGKKLGLKKDFLFKLLKTIHQEALQIQNEIMNKDKS
jgi:chorismate mutase